MPLRHYKYNKGGALISALFITAICAMMAVALMMRERLLIHEGELVIQSDQAYLDLQGVQNWAKVQVLDFVAQGPAVTNPRPLQAVFSAIQLDNRQISGIIEDAQGKYNINNLQSVINQPQFVALLRAVAPGVSAEAAANIAQAITAWMTNGVQDRFYLSLKPPYRSGHTQMANITELRLVAGISPEIYEAIAPYIIALPLQQGVAPTAPALPVTPGAAMSAPAAPQTPININSASAFVFLTLNPNLSLSQAESLVACRSRSGLFSNTQTFMANCVKPLNLPQTVTLGNITAQSNYYLVYADAITGNRALQLTSLLAVSQDSTNKLKVSVEWQSFH